MGSFDHGTSSVVVCYECILTCKSDCVLLTLQNVVRITTLEIYLYDNYVMFFQIGPKQTSHCLQCLYYLLASTFIAYFSL